MRTNKIIAITAPVEIMAGESDGKPPRFTTTFYTGGKIEVEGWELPVVVDLSALDESKVLVANLDHDRTKRVGNFAVANDGRSLVASGTAHPDAFESAKQVVTAGLGGYKWQSSLEVTPKRGGITEVKAGKSLSLNGQKHEGPFYAVKGTLKGFAFVSHGADDNTVVSIAASAANSQGNSMKPEVKAWVQSVLPSLDIESLSADEVTNLEAQYAGLHPAKPKKSRASALEAQEAEAERIEAIDEYALKAREKAQGGPGWREVFASIGEVRERAIEERWSVDKFRLEILEAGLPMAHGPRNGRRDDRITNKVIEAAICQAGRLGGYEKMFDDQTLQLAHDRFKNGIGLKQLFLLCAEANGYRSNYGGEVTLDAQRAAFGMSGQPTIRAQGWSTLDIATVLSATANKFVMEGWNSVDQTCLRISKIQNVRDFKTITTVSLTDSLMYEKVGGGGEIKHGSLGEITYTNKADTYAKMLAITRQDIINDDLSALTEVPRKLGNGAIKKLNDIFWTEFLALVGASFFASGNANINTGVADMTVGGLDATETIFMNQTNPDGTPLGLMPAILLVPTALKNKALTLMGSQLNAAAITSYAAATGDANPFQGRFRVESSPYISNSNYTGYTSTAWWMLANPNDLPVIAIAALNGRVEPTVDTADADFNTLGVQMRGYSDVGVKRQEYRGGVHADGGSS